MLSGRRKTIGVFLCKAYVLFDNAVYHALEEEALRLNCNIVVFATVGYFASRNSYDKQERRMFGFAPIEIFTSFHPDFTVGRRISLRLPCS